MEKGIIERIRGGNATLKDYRHISTSQWITVCLGIGRADQLPPLHRDLRDAWQRLDQRQRAVVLEAWGLATIDVADLVNHDPTPMPLHQLNQPGVVSDLIDSLERAIVAAGHKLSGPTDHRAAEDGEPVWVCNARGAIAEAKRQAAAFLTDPRAIVRESAPCQAFAGGGVEAGPGWSYQLITFPRTPGVEDLPGTTTKIGHAQINDVDFHITAIPVEGEGSEQKPLDSADCFEALQSFDGCEPGFETMDIGGTPHVVVFTPFQS